MNNMSIFISINRRCPEVSSQVHISDFTPAIIDFLSLFIVITFSTIRILEFRIIDHGWLEVVLFTVDGFRASVNITVIVIVVINVVAGSVNVASTMIEGNFIIPKFAIFRMEIISFSINNHSLPFCLKPLVIKVVSFVSNFLKASHFFTCLIYIIPVVIASSNKRFSC
ncbi:unknown [Streptococcus salivarius CAG:79]|nr:unknown [Streptococcus salivarius CAG:79]